METLVRWLDENKLSYALNVQLKDFSYMKTGGIVDVLIKPSSTQEVSACIVFLGSHQIKYKVVGATTNLLFLDDASYSCLLSTEKLNEVVRTGEDTFETGSGCMLPEIARYALYNSWSGFEGMEGIPGTMGGAVFMNAGAYGYEIKDVLSFVEIVCLDGKVATYAPSELKFRNRDSALRMGEVTGVVTRCGFKVRQGNEDQISQRMALYHSKRHKYLEYAYPNLGSIFAGSIYRDLGKNDNYFYFLSSMFYLFNYKWKIFRRESPLDRKWINKIAVKRFNLNFERQPFSDKTLNCLVNRGQGTEEMVRYIETISQLTKGRVPVENEIVEKF